MEVNSIVINLPGREDRLVDFFKEARKFDIELNPLVMHGLIDSSPHIGIAKAHQKCVKHAKDNKFNHVLIMEDDLLIRHGAYNYLNKALNVLPEDWDILLGGVYSSEKLTPYNEYWSKTGEFSGLHFYIVNAKAYDTILNFKYNSHIDRFMASPQSGLNCYVTNKFFALQRPGHSDNVGMYKDYSELLDKFDLL